MSFSLIGPFAFGQKVTSAQFNQLDSDHADAFDKSVAGDAFAGQASFAGGYFLFNQANTARVNTTSAVQVNAAGGIEGKIFAAIRPTVAGGIASSVVAGIQAGVAGGIASGAPGGFRLTGGSTDWVGFDVARARTVAYSTVLLTGATLASGWTLNMPWIVGPASSTTQTLVLPPPHNGATILSISVSFSVNPHTGVPANLPGLNVRRRDISDGTGVTFVDLSTTTFQAAPTPVSGAAWYAGGAMQSFPYFCNQNNVVDTSKYVYEVGLTDENGANSVSGTIFAALKVDYSVPNMQFQ